MKLGVVLTEVLSVQEGKEGYRSRGDSLHSIGVSESEVPTHLPWDPWSPESARTLVTVFYRVEGPPGPGSSKTSFLVRVMVLRPRHVGLTDLPLETWEWGQGQSYRRVRGHSGECEGAPSDSRRPCLRRAETFQALE